MRRKTNDAIKIIHGRYIKGDPDRKLELQQERITAEVARLVYDLRKSAGLSQKELAELVGTKQSVISRLEDSDYEGHSLSMLNKIAKAVNNRIKISYVADNPQAENMRYAFQIVMKKLRMRKNLSVEEIAEKLDARVEDIYALERSYTYRPAPMMLYKLSQFFEVPQSSLNVLAGATTDVPPKLDEEASRFAAQSESFEKLTQEEKKILDDFITFLKKEFQHE